MAFRRVYARNVHAFTASLRGLNSLTEIDFESAQYARRLQFLPEAPSMQELVASLQEAPGGVQYVWVMTATHDKFT